jgi:hypothetical protein
MIDKCICNAGIFSAGTREFENWEMRRIYLPIKEVSLEEIT